MATTHYLKTVQPYFEALKSGIKKFEFRKDDRGYQVGDILLLREWSEIEHKVTGNILFFKITYILDISEFSADLINCIILSLDPYSFH